MAGIELLLAALCFNVMCNVNNGTNKNAQNKSTSYVFYDSDTESSQSVKTQMLDKLKSELYGKTIRVTSLEDFPLSYTMNVNGTLVGHGVAFELLEFLTEKFKFKYELIMPKNNILGSTTDMEGSILKMIADGEVDMAAAFLPILADARKHMLYSTSLDEGEWIMIMIRPAESASGSGLLAPFDRDVWFLILVSLLAVGPIIYLLIIFRYQLTRDKIQEPYGLPHCVWFVYGALMKQGSTLTPTGDSTRILFATWWIFITILTSFYTANLTAFLTLSKFTLPINNVADILKKEKQFVTQRGNGVEYAIRNTDEALTQLNTLVDKKLVEFTTNPNDTDILVTEVEKQNYVFVRDRPAIDHLIYDDYRYRKTISASNEKIHCPFAVAKIPFLTRRRAFGYPLDTKWNLLFDPQILHLVESGIVKYKLLEGLPHAEICPQNLGGTERQLRNGDLMTTYYVMLTGFVTSAVVFFSEMFFRILNNRKLKRTQSDIPVPSRPEKLSYLQQELGYSPPPPYATIFSRYEGNNFSRNGWKNVNRIVNSRDFTIVKERNKQKMPRPSSGAILQYSYTN